MIKKCLLLIITGYQRLISPILPARCRYYPTCSEYAKIAVNWHGSYVGSKLIFKRICSCHPLGGSGLDFVPLPMYRHTFRPVALNSFRDKVLVNTHMIDSVSRGTFVPHLHDRGIYKDSTSYIAIMNSKLAK